MGLYVNLGNEGFSKILRGTYVDKTGLVALFDSTLDTTDGLVMVSRPRRVVKSFAAQSIVAFYSCGADSRMRARVARASVFDSLRVTDLSSVSFRS